MRSSRFALWPWGLALLFSVVFAWPSRPLAAPVFHNRLDAPIVEVYGAAPGNTPWATTGPVASGQKAAVDDSRLNGCARLIVRFNDNIMLQFFTLSYLAGSETITLRTHRVKDGTVNDFPQLVVAEQGQAFAVAAGLPFHLLQGDMEADMLTKARWAEWMNPLDLKDFAPEAYAVNLAGVSWRIAPGTAEFADSTKGGPRLRGIRLSAPVDGRTVARFLDDLQSCGARPLLLEMRPGAAIAFSSDGLALGAAATLLEGMDQADADKRWETLRQQIIALKMSEAREDEDSSLRLVFASEALRYELRLTAGELEAELRMERRCVRVRMTGRRSNKPRSR